MPRTTRTSSLIAALFAIAWLTTGPTLADPPAPIDPVATAEWAAGTATTAAYGALAEITAKVPCTAADKRMRIEGPSPTIERRLPVIDYVWQASTTVKVGGNCPAGVSAYVRIIDESPLPGQLLYDSGPIKQSSSGRLITATIPRLVVPYYGTTAGARQVATLTVIFKAYHQGKRFACEQHIYQVIASPTGPVMTENVFPQLGETRPDACTPNSD